MPTIRPIAITLALALCAACGADTPKTEEKKPEAAAPTASAPALQKYDMKGKVLSIDKPAKSMTVDHEAIPNFMGAMAMPYDVHDAKALETVAPGDQITAKVVSSGS